MRIKPCLLILVALCSSTGFAQSPKTSFKFDFFRSRRSASTKVTADMLYTADRGFGFEQRPNATISGTDYVTSNQPLSFSVAVPEGNYRVTITLGNPEKEATTTVKAETRRLMVEPVHTAAGKFETRTFAVNTRRMEIGNTGEKVEADLREWPAYWTWDEKLTVTVIGDNAAFTSLEITKADDITTVFLMGDSTVTDQMNNNYGTWGQNLPRWFDDKVAIANLAESGETVKGFRHEKRWDKVLSMAKKGDYIFMQFGHNEVNSPGGFDGMWPRESWSASWGNKISKADTDYKQGLIDFINEAKAKGAIPVVVTPMTKVSTAGRGPAQTATPNAGLAAYASNAILAAEATGAPYIDLFAMSTDMHNALGPQNSGLAVMDGNHSNLYGGYVLSRCVVNGIKEKLPDLAKHLLADVGTFDPKHPEPLPDAFKLPTDPGQPGIPNFGFGGRGARGPASAPSTNPAPRAG